MSSKQTIGHSFCWRGELAACVQVSQLRTFLLIQAGSKKAFIKDVAQSQPIRHAMATEVPQQDSFHFDWKESLASATKLQNVTYIYSGSSYDTEISAID